MILKVIYDYTLIFDPSSGTIYGTGKGFANKVELLEPVLFYEKRDFVGLRRSHWPKAHEPFKMPLTVGHAKPSRVMASFS